MKRRPRRQEHLRQELGPAEILALVAIRGRRAAPTGCPHLGEGVAKQKCGSCHFFQEAGLAGSGWCHHPQRKVSSGVLIMVRRNELACRDEWSRSLWQPASGQHSNDEVPFQRPLAVGPLPPANPESMRSILNADATTATTSDGEDILLSEARIVSETDEPLERPERLFPSGNFDPRTAIFRAREAYRERVRAKAVADRALGVAEASANSGASAAEGPADELTESAPMLDVTHAAFDETETRPPESSPWPEERVATELIAAKPELKATGSFIQQAAEGGVLPHMDDLNVVQSELDRGPSTPHSDRAAVPAATAHISDQTDLAPRIQVNIEAESFPDWYRTDLPRICRACRDYRPSADRQRGWCANAWAFTHRRLVNEDNIAPCRSAIGDWWVPVDDVWLVAADVSSHGRATPLLDRISGSVDTQRRRS